MREEVRRGEQADEKDSAVDFPEKVTIHSAFVRGICGNGARDDGEHEQNNADEFRDHRRKHGELLAVREQTNKRSIRQKKKVIVKIFFRAQNK